MTREQITTALSFVAALGIVAGFVYLFAAGTGGQHRDVASTVNRAPTAAATPPRPSPESSTPASAPPADAGGTGSGIFRCDVAGRVVYSDTRCPHVPNREVDVAVNQGFLPPEQRDPTYAETTTTNTTPALSNYTTAPAVADNNAYECNELDAAINANEDVARHPQFGVTQDRLTREKRELQRRKHELNC